MSYMLAALLVVVAGLIFWAAMSRDFLAKQMKARKAHADQRARFSGKQAAEGPIRLKRAAKRSFGNR